MFENPENGVEPGDEFEPEPIRTAFWVEAGLALALVLALGSLYFCFDQTQDLKARDKAFEQAIVALNQKQQDLAAAFIALHRGEGPIGYYDGNTTRSVSW